MGHCRVRTIMEILWDRGFVIIEWLQSTFPGLEPLMVIISDLGTFEAYLALVLWLYWCMDKARGRRLAYLLAITNLGVNTFKHLFRAPRPFWLLEGPVVGETSGFGLPSGHVSTATVTFTYLAAAFRRRWLTAFAIIWIILMAISRMYLRQHFLIDVIGGVIMGSVVMGGFVAWNRYIQPQFKDRILGQRFWLAALVPVAVFVVYALIVVNIPPPAYLADLSDVAFAAERFAWEDTVFATAAIMGLGLGFILEGRDVRFLVDGKWWVKIIRFVIGLTIDLFLLYGLRSLFLQIATEESNFILYLALRFIRYFFTSMAAVYFIPMFFTRVGLMDAEPEPQLTATINRVVPQKGERDSSVGSGGF